MDSVFLKSISPRSISIVFMKIFALVLKHFSDRQIKIEKKIISPTRRTKKPYFDIFIDDKSINLDSMHGIDELMSL